MTPTATPTPPPGDQPGTIVSAESGACLTASSQATGAAIEFISCASPTPAAQLWQAVEVEPSLFEFHAQHSEMCLSVDGDQAGDPLVQWPCDANPAQRFTIVGTTLRADHTGFCLDGLGDTTVVGTPVVQQPCDDSASQNLIVNAGIVPADERALIGFWGPVIDTPLVPVAGANLPDGRVLVWSAYDTLSFGGANGYTQTALFDPITTLSTSREVANTGHDMFCPGIANLADGRILVNGGSNNRKTSIYDPVTDSWVAAPEMNVPRGYQGTTLLPNGDVFTIGGSWSGGQGNKIGEVWSDGSGWDERAAISGEDIATDDGRGIYRADNHVWLFAWENDTVFHAGPSQEMHWIDPSGAGSITSAGTRGTADAMNGNAVMYEPGKILAVGGAPGYDSDSPGSDEAFVVDISSGSAVTRQVGSLANPRTLASSVVLPNGQVVVTGGQGIARLFSDFAAVLETELFDPATETFHTMASMSVPRTYHSIGLLLTDGRVLVGGGGLCGNCQTNHPDVQIFTPPYLFGPDGELADRPAILSAPASASYGQVVSVQTDVDVDEFSLVRMASATHSLNNDQRRIPVDAASLGAGSASVSMPTSSGIAPPGLYMLFAMNDRGVPSVAHIIQLG